MESDSLRSVRNSFYLGLYNEVAEEVAAIDAGNKEAKAWGDVFLARSQLALNPAAFQPSPNAPTAIQAVKQLATYLQTEDDHKDMILDTLKDWLATPDLQADLTLQIIAAHIYILHGNLKEALALVANDADNLEKLSLCVSIYLQLNRVDLAAKSLKAMSDVDDDDTLTQLCSAWVAVAQGGEKQTEAAFALQELLDKFGPSVPVLNCLAVCDIHARNYAQAFQHTKQARDLALKQGVKVSAETLLNSIVCLQHLRKGAEVVDKIRAELKQNYPNHPALRKEKEAEAMFDKYAESFRDRK